MKIIHIIPNLKKGGAERLVLNIAQELTSRSNVEVCLVIFSNDNHYPFLSENIDLRVIPALVIPSIKGPGVVKVHQLQEFIKDFKPNVIHTHLFLSEMIVSKLKLDKSVIRIVHFHDNILQFSNITWRSIFSKKKITNFYERLIVLKSYSKNTKIICISKDTFEFAQSVFKGKVQSILLFNSIDLKRFNRIDENIHSKDITIIGSLVDKKGQSLAIEVISVLKKRGFDVNLNILGDGINKSALKALVEKLGIKSNVFFHGNQDFPEIFLQKSYLYLHTAIYEPFGLVLIEAMATGLPIVCTDGKGNRDLIVEGENGFMIWERNPELIADKIELLLTNNSMRNEMSEKAFRFAQQFGINHYIDKLIDIYQKSL
jgi:glycosyltransferase involved in cell wall biosynthesis